MGGQAHQGQHQICGCAHHQAKEHHRLCPHFVNEFSAHGGPDKGQGAHGNDEISARSGPQAQGHFANLRNHGHGDDDAAHKEADHHGDNQVLIGEELLVEHGVSGLSLNQHKGQKHYQGNREIDHHLGSG